LSYRGDGFILAQVFIFLLLYHHTSFSPQQAVHQHQRTLGHLQHIATHHQNFKSRLSFSTLEIRTTGTLLCSWLEAGAEVGAEAKAGGAMGITGSTEIMAIMDIMGAITIKDIIIPVRSMSSSTGSSTDNRRGMEMGMTDMGMVVTEMGVMGTAGLGMEEMAGIDMKIWL
jgi:hypothetical protein